MPLVRLENFQQFAAINVLLDPGHKGGPVVVPNCVQIVLNWNTSSGRGAHNVLYGRAGGVPAPTSAQAEAIRSALTTGAAWTAVAALMPTAHSLASVSLRSVHTPNNPLVLSTGAAAPGTSANPGLPNEMAICVTLRTGSAGISGRGRTYLPGFDNAQVNVANQIAAACVTAVNTWVAGWASIFSSQGYTWVLGLPARNAYTGSTGTQHPARDATSVAVTTATVRNNTWDSQRRRGLK